MHLLINHGINFEEAKLLWDDVNRLQVEAKSRPGLKQRRVNVDFPGWILNSLDREAKKSGVTRQSIIKVWIAERIKIESNQHG